ncbi:MAG TPA: hypothetical protein VMH80_14680 [Bryobacteraceae bacterium]|nr:hypothetical protein [Bryobacteraceae bacterium]
MSSSRKRYSGHSDKNLHQRQFLEAFAVCCSVQKAARWAGVHRQTHYDWLDEDPTYPARFEEARRRAGQTLEDEAVRRAVEGVRRPVLYRGKQVYIQGEPQYEVEYSDQLLIRLLEAMNPEKYRHHHEHLQIAKLWELEPQKLTDKQLQVLGDYLVKKAEEESRLQVAAGTRVIDAQSTAIEST